jgi:catechol 2,3-dioxygenase-like lactoylglutathione lyase family enzyme
VSELDGLRVLFVAGFGPIVRAPESAAFYRDTLGLPLEAQPGADAAYLHTEKMSGVKHFALWPLSQAARSCFGVPEWPQTTPEPRAWIEFDVENLATASEVLKKKGYTLLVDNREEPWGQAVTRLIGPEGILVGLTVTPWLRD